MTKLTLRVVVMAVATVSAALGPAGAEVLEPPESFVPPPPKDTVYATDHHMGFSLRSSVVYWFGGAPIVDANDLRASQRERWWGEDVPLLPGEVLRLHR